MAWYRRSNGGGRGRAVLVALFALGVSHSAIAFAQAVSGPSDEIVVTAEKRDATVQRTPISITALRGVDLQQAGLSNITAVAQQVPGVSFKTGGTGQTELEMRGLNSAGGNSPTVGLYLDETPLTSFAFATAGKVVIDPDLYDLNRVEVLRGPQGTLYGAGSMGGTVRLLSNQPVLDRLGASGELIGTTTKRGSLGGTANAMINIPIVEDVVALRLVGSEKYTGGWIDRKVLDRFPFSSDPSGLGFGTVRGDVESAPVAKTVHNANSNHLQSVRGSLLIQPSDRLSLVGTGMYQKIHSDGQYLIDASQTSTTLTSVNGAQYRMLGADYQPNDTKEPVDDSFKLGSLTAKYDLGGAQIVSTTSYWQRSLSQVQDGSEVIQYVFGLPSFYTAGGGLGSGPWIEADTAHQLSQEVRLTSTSGSRFQWLVGGFYSRLRSRQHQYANYTDPAAVAVFAGIDPFAVDANGKATTFDQTVVQTINQKALFGELSYQITSSLKLTGGVRYYRFNNASDSSEFGLFAPSGDLIPEGNKTRERDHGFNPKVNLSYQPSRDLTVYATVAKGFRPGGANQIVPTQGVAAGGTPEGDACAASLSSLGRTGDPTAYGPDHVWSYEAGEKARLFGGPVTVNSSGYFERWKNIQRSVTLGCAYIYTDNAGSANIYGGELEIAAKLSNLLTLSVTGGYTHATYDNVYTLPNFDGDGVVSRTGVQNGQRLPDVPRFTSSQSLVYTQPLSEKYSFVARVTNAFVGSREETTSAFTNGSGNSNIPVHLNRYDIVSARFGIIAKANWSVFLFGDNLTNDQSPLSAINSQVLNIAPVRRETIARPRSFGIDLSFNY